MRAAGKSLDGGFEVFGDQSLMLFVGRLKLAAFAAVRLAGFFELAPTLLARSAHPTCKLSGLRGAAAGDALEGPELSLGQMSRFGLE